MGIFCRYIISTDFTWDKQLELDKLACNFRVIIFHGMCYLIRFAFLNLLILNNVFLIKGSQ